ncbi:MAG TPA: magnesium transporter [Polyangiaceae bacterium]|nr:magnesium transporter [Polyangiaceae bacterium]
MRLARLIGPELKTLLAEHPEEVQEVLGEIHPEDLADFISDLDDKQAGELLTHLPTEYAAQVFGRLGDSKQEAVAEEIGVDSTAQIVVEMDADERADFLSQLPPKIGADLLQEIERVDPEVAEDVEALAKWPETSAGGLMTTDYISISPNLMVKDAIDELRRHAGEAETVDVIFAVSHEKQLLGILSLRQMLIAEPYERIRDVMVQNVISVRPDLHQEEVARKLAKYDFNVMPVVSDDGRLLGVITADDVLDVLTEEQTEDVQKMAGVEPIREGYFDATTAVMFRKRAPWLIVLFVGEFFSGTALRANDKVLAAIGHLSFYIPLLASAGGNSGSQSSTLVIRGLATGDIRGVDWLKVFVRELSQGVALGLTLAFFGYIRASTSGDGGRFAVLVATTVVGLVIIGCVVGAMLPILLHALKQDPATTSTPFIATLIDALGILLYMALARWILADVLARAHGLS